MGQTKQDTKKRGGLIAIWVIAILLMAGTVVYQRLTGPTHPKRGSYTLAGTEYSYKLKRSGLSDKPDGDGVVSPGIMITIPYPRGATARLHYKRYRTDDSLTTVKMTPSTDPDHANQLTGLLPPQPAAGKLVYHLTMTQGNERIRIPEGNKDEIILRCKNWVPPYFLIPHIVLMFFAILFGIRAFLGAVFMPASMRKWSWVSLILIISGGFVFGPIVQKYAFGEYWTGWPWGYDWTDNKVAIMGLSWIIACGVMGFKARRQEWLCRLITCLAAIIMIGVYLIPHSMGGSELDYRQVDQGIDPAKAIKTGDR